MPRPMTRRAFARLAATAFAAPALVWTERRAKAESRINKSFLGGTAIDGFDPVAYFTAGRPVEGSSRFSHHWKGATWHFASAKNRDAFAADAQRFAPQYRGYCAWAVSQGQTAGIDPEAWRIVGSRLFLNYSKAIQARWAKDVPGNIAKADANWPGIGAGLSD